MPDNKHNYEYNYDLGDVIDNAVQMGSKIGSSVLGSIADALEQAGDAMGMKQPDTFAAWKRRLERKRPVRRCCADGGWLDLCRLLWHRGAGHGYPDRCWRGPAGPDPR